MVHDLHAVGCEISDQMCLQAHLINQQQGIDTDTVQIVQESFLQLSAIRDLVVNIDIDSLLHVGPGRQRSAQCHSRSGKDFATGWVVGLYRYL